jgi:hypothetical protein
MFAIFVLFVVFLANAESNNEYKSYHLYNHLVNSGSSGYTSTDDLETHKTPVEVYELTSYRHFNKAVDQPQPQPQPQQYPNQQYYQPQLQQIPQPQQSTKPRGIFGQDSPTQPQPQPQQYPNQQYYQPQLQQIPQPQQSTKPRGIFGGNKTQAKKQTLTPSGQNLFGYNKYYAMNFGHPFKESYQFSTTQGGNTTSITESDFVPIRGKRGILGLYIGRRLQRISAIRFEYGAQWELLSFNAKTATEEYNVFNHNVGLSVRTFFDLPLSHSFFLSGGLEGNYGVLNHIVADDQTFNSGLSYALLGGVTMRISQSRAIYFLFRQGMIPSKDYKVSNATRTANFSSSSIVVGIQLFSS